MENEQRSWDVFLELSDLAQEIKANRLKKGDLTGKLALDTNQLTALWEANVVLEAVLKTETEND